MPEVSVVIPSYNHARFLHQAISSVLNQTLPDLELIIVDDGSSDNSLDIIGSFHDPRIRLLSQTNQGAHIAINRGIELSVSKYVSILNSDDFYHPGRLEKLLSALKSDPEIGLASSYVQVVDPQNQPLGVKEGYHNLEPWLLKHPERSFRNGNDLKVALISENYLSTTSNYVFRRDLISRIGWFRPLRYAHDWDFALRSSVIAGLFLSPEPLLSYRVHPNNTIRENQAAMIFEICWILAVHLPEHVKTLSVNPQLDPVFLDRLLNSIYTFDCDRVLVGLLSESISNNLSRAEEYLNPTDPCRNVYIRYIQSVLDEQKSTSPTPITKSIRSIQFPGREFIRRIYRKLKRMSNV